MLGSHVRQGIGLYIHIPFCTAKCGYCDFNSYAGHDHLVPSYTESLITEASLWAKTLSGRPVETIFFGGGTPSLTPVADLERILGAAQAALSIAPGAEISLEANPGSLSVEYLGALRGIGVNRLSIGVQSFDDAELRALDRIHTGDDARAAFAAAREAGFDNVNLDFIYGLPEQPLAAWQRTLEVAIALGPEHLSLYALTVEEGTPLARDIARGRVPAPDGDVQADHYEWTMDRMAAAGYEQYEISNWAQPGRQCKHNLIYWQNREYLGLGAGAHSHLNGMRFSAVLLPNRYIDLVAESAQPDADGATSMRHLVGGEQVDAETAMADTLILGLRLTDGVDLQAFATRHGRTVDDLHGQLIAEFISYGVLERTERSLRLTPRGRLLSNELFQRLLPPEREAAAASAAGRA
jgi:oxygen-independent coproporphyrinogen-3 oxidase